MKGNRRGQPTARAPSPSPTSPTAKGTSKYTNKDGSKFITVPKPLAAESPQPSPPPVPPSSLSLKGENVPPETTGSNGSAPPVNRKKAKRRAKAAAKLMAEQGPDDRPNGLPASVDAGHHRENQAEGAHRGSDADFDSSAAARFSQPNPPEGHGHDPEMHGKSKKSKNKKGKGSATVSAEDASFSHRPLSPQLDPQPGPGLSKAKIWDTSYQEERERIKEFWLGLGEDERKSLVKVEKDAVLKKMKEQQKHTCGCTVCGRKRNAIEEELEGLYDAYYQELEQYAHDPNHQGQGPPMMGPPRNFNPTAGLHSHGMPANYSGHQPHHGRIVEQLEDDEEDGDDDYSEDELDDDEEDDYSAVDDEDIPPDEGQRDYSSDFFNFGNSLTVQGGILTVADDLLKNDGKKFIEMMEQLAERRMAREADAREQYTRGPEYSHNVNGGYAHNHPPSEEDDYGPEDEDEDDFDSGEEDYDDEEESLTEDQRMEEGRRMFQIFAARMFEQRVLTAYREKVAKERQEKLLEELADEDAQESQRKAKKAKEAQKRKDKAAQKKQAQAEEKARKDAEKAAETAHRQAEEERKIEEQRLKAEEKRKKKEVQKKVDEEERLRKEGERQRRAHEQKERQAELERKAREAKEREKKAREEAKLKEKETRERKEREVRERREKQEKDKRDKDARAKANEAKERQRHEERVAQKASAHANAVNAPVPITLPKRPSQHPNTVPALPQQPPTSFASPQIPMTTPALPKAPTPMRPRQASQQGASTTGSTVASQAGSGQSQNPSPNPTTPAHTSPGSVGPGRGNVIGHPGVPNFPPTSPLGTTIKPAMPQPVPFNVMPPMGMGFSMGMPPVAPPPGFGPPGQFGPMGSGNFPVPGPPPMMHMPPGLGGPGRGFAPVAVAPPPGFSHPSPDSMIGMGQFGSLPKEGGAPATHSRQGSAGFEPPLSSAPPTQPIARPAPIGRPSSTVMGQRHISGSSSQMDPISGADNDDAAHLGSKALLDDSDFPLDDFQRSNLASRPNFAPGLGGFGVDPNAAFAAQSPIWNQPPNSLPHGNPFAHAPPGFPMGGGWPAPTNASVFASHGNMGRSQPRISVLRRLLCEACKELGDSAKADSEAAGDAADRLLPIDVVKSRVKKLGEESLSEPVQDAELVNLYDTEGNDMNGGGNFEIQRDESNQVVAIRWVASDYEKMLRKVKNAGKISSPVIGFSS